MASPHQVVIDDTDSQVRYFGSGWFEDVQGSQDNVGNFGPTYNKTSHGTNGNDSISFSFVGSSVTILGTTNLTKIDSGTSFDPSWECFIDQISVGATQPFRFPENNWVLCQQEMIEGPHEITINVTTAGNTFWFDYLTYTPSPTVSHDKVVLSVQNTDSAIRYGVGWIALGQTANMTTEVGSEVIFDFVGTSLTWVGFIPTELPHDASIASYSIDNGPSVNFKLSGLPPTATTTVYNQEFFTTPDLTVGPHTIIVKYEGGNRPSTPLTLDYLLVTNVSLPAAVSSNVTTSTIVTSSSTTASSTTTTTTTITSVSPAVHAVTPIGPIVGGVVGGLAVIAILLFVSWWWRRRRTTHIGYDTKFLGSGPSLLPLQAGPSTLLYPSTGVNRPYSPRSDVSNDTNVSSDINSSLPNIHTDTHASSVDASDESGYVTETIEQIRAIRKSQNRNMAPRPNVTSVMHQDSGIRLHPLNLIMEEVPLCIPQSEMPKL